MKTSSFLFNGYIYPMETTSTSDTTYISVRIPDLSEEMILNKTPFKALLQCVCSRDNYSISSYSGNRMKVAFSFNGIARDTEVRVYPYNTIYKDIYEYGEEIPSVTYSNGGLYLVEYMNKRTTILPISNLADISRMSNNEYFFPFDVHISGINMSLKQLSEVVDELNEASSGTVHTDSKGNIVSSADVKANSGAISLVTISQAVETLKTAQAEQLQSIQNLTKLTSTLQEALNNLQMDLDNVVVYTNEGDIIFKDSKSVEVSLRRFYESVAPAVAEYGETLSSHSDTLQTLSQTVTRLGETVSSMESDVSGYGSSIEELQNNLIALSKTVADLIDSLDLSKYLTLDKDGNANIPNDVFFNGSELPEDYSADTQSLIDVITLLADNITTIQGTIEDMEETLSSLTSSSNRNLEQLEFGENSGGSTVSETSEIKDGYYADGNGGILDNTSSDKTFWRTEEYSLAIKPMTTYTLNLDAGGVYTIWFVDGSKKNIQKISCGGENNFCFKTPANAAYLNVSGQKNNGTPSKIWLNDGTESKEYEPYIPSVKMLNEEQAKQNESLDNLSKGGINLACNFVQGGISGKVGSQYITNDISNRCRTDKKYLSDITSIIPLSIPSSYRVGITSYNSSDVMIDDSGWLTGTVDYERVENTSYIAIAVSKIDDTDITPQVAEQLGIKALVYNFGEEIDNIKKDLGACVTKEYMQKYSGGIVYGQNSSGTGMFVIPLERYIATSLDGVTKWEVDWECNLDSILDSDEIILGITYGNGKFVCFTNKGFVLYSSDAITWTKRRAIVM